jgi:predicted amidohydrolase
MILAVVQTDPQFGKKTENIRQTIEMMESVPADFYVLPELFASGYNFSTIEEVRALSESFPEGETFTALKNFSVKHQCYIVYGFAEREAESFYNSAGMVGYDGKTELYRKIHLFDREKLFFQPGNMGFRVHDTPYGKVGIMVCFDWYFPESARTLAIMGAQLIAHPSNLVLPNCPNSMPVRCLENRVFAATANRIGTEFRGGISLTYIGQSQITSVKGEILHRTSMDKAEIAVREINLMDADNKNITERNHLFDDRRPEYYA